MDRKRHIEREKGEKERETGKQRQKRGRTLKLL